MPESRPKPAAGPRRDRAGLAGNRKGTSGPPMAWSRTTTGWASQTRHPGRTRQRAPSRRCAGGCESAIPRTRQPSTLICARRSRRLFVVATECLRHQTTRPKKLERRSEPGVFGTRVARHERPVSVKNFNSANSPYRACAGHVARCSAPRFSLTFRADNLFPPLPIGAYALAVADGFRLLPAPPPPGALRINFSAARHLLLAVPSQEITYNLPCPRLAKPAGPLYGTLVRVTSAQSGTLTT